MIYNSRAVISIYLEDSLVKTAYTPEEADAYIGTLPEGQTVRLVNGVERTIPYSRPRVAAIYYGKDFSDTVIARLARFPIAVLSIRNLGVEPILRSLKFANPSIRAGSYVKLSEWRATGLSTDPWMSATDEINRNNWWLRTADGQLVQQMNQPGEFDVNPTLATKRNVNNQRWPEFKASWDRPALEGSLWDFAFVDNILGVTRQPANWMCVSPGKNLPPRDPAASAAMRAGIRTYLDALRAYKLPLWGNVDFNGFDNLDSPEYSGQLSGALCESAIGKNYSLETWAGFDRMMQLYSRVLSQAGDAIFGVRSDSQSERLYGLCTGLLLDGYTFIAAKDIKAYEQLPVWMEEFDAPLGLPVSTAGVLASGIWARQFANGVVAVNPSKTDSLTFPLMGKYHTVQGGGFNGGILLPPRSGALLIRD